MLEVVANPGELYQRALACHRAGDLALAAALYRQTLELAPGEPQVLFLLGVAAYQAGDFAGAVEPLQQAVAGAPNDAAWHNQLGMALRRAGRAAEGLRSLERAASIDPLLADVQYNLGNALLEAGELARAAECHARAAEMEPANPHFLAAHGQALERLGLHSEAEGALRRAVTLLPEDAGLRCDWGDALLALGQTEAALEQFERAERLDGRLARAAYSAGCGDTARKNYARAAECFARALALQPDWAEAEHNLAQSRFYLGEVTKAVEGFRSAAAKNPAAALTMIAVIIPGDPASDADRVFEARRKFARRVLPAPRPDERFAGRTRGPKIRLGYLSSFFHRPNWMKPVWALINQHDRERFEVHLFSDAPRSAVEGGYRANPADVFHDISEDGNEPAADRIEAAGIDLLIDLNGYSAVRRLPLVALHPAPVVCGWFNYYATSGIDGVDYVIGDRTAISDREELTYSERVLNVPGSYLTFDVSYETPPVVGSADLGRPFRFGCLAPLYKITPECVVAWSEILHETPGSTLTLKNRAFEWPEAAARVRGLFECAGIGADRLRLLGPSAHYEFLETYGEIDLALDTFPYNGGTTTTEALWQGVPVWSFRGDRWVSRTSASILRAAGFAEFLARDREEYIGGAVAMANSAAQRARLSELRTTMRARLAASPVCATRTFAKRMERLFAKIAPRY